MNRSPSASRRPLERGQFSWVTLLLVAVVAGVAYLGVVWVPVYALHYEVKQTVRDFMNRAVKNPDDAALVQELCRKLQGLAFEEEEGEDGRRRRVPVVDVSPKDVTWERDTSVKPPMLRVALEYVRLVRYPFLDRVDERVMQVDITQDIAIPDWGPGR